MKASDIRRGHIVLIGGQPCRVMDFQHRTPGNLRAFVQLRLRNLITGNTFDQRVSATDFVEEARLDLRECQVLYRDDAGVHAMDTQTYEQYLLDQEAVGDAGPWLEPEMHFQLELLDGRPIGVQLPAVGEYTIVETAPVMRGATKTASTKPAKLNNGVMVQVPEFLGEGDKIRVDPRSGAYLERAK
jgi:elongation factor P